MKHSTLAAALMFVAVLSVSSDPVWRESGATNVFAQVQCREISLEEMEEVSGALRIFGIRILPRLFRVNRKQRTTAPAKVHCDIIAQNKADDMNLNTSNQDGSSSDYNQVKVNQIYNNYPDNRSTTPPAGSAGYVFTAYGGDMQHMEAYSRGSNSDGYDHHWNDSYTEQTSPRDVGYSAPGVTQQVFVPLPEYGYADLYYR